MKLKPILTILLFTLFLHCIGGQQQNPYDSLFRLLSVHPEKDTTRANLLLHLAKNSLPSNLDTAEYYFNQLNTLSIEIGYADGQINGMNGLGVCNWYKNNSKGAIHSFRQALQLARLSKNPTLETKVAGNLGSFYNVLGITDSAEYYQQMAVESGKNSADKTIYAKALGDLGLVKYNKGDYVRAIENYMKAKEILGNTKSYRDLTSLYTKLGMLYYDLSDFDKCIAAYRNAAQTNKLHKEKGFDAEILQNMGLAYFDLKKDFDSATIMLMQAIVAGRNQGRLDVELTAMGNLGNIYLEKEESAKAIYYYLKVMNSPLIHSRNKLKAAVLTNLGTAYHNLGNDETGLKYTQQGLKLSEEQGFIAYQKQAFKSLSAIAASKKDYKSAFEYEKKYSVLNDTLGSAEIKRKVEATIFRNSLQQKENENLLLQKDNEIKHQTIQSQRLYLIIFVIVILLGLVILLHRIRTNRKLRELNTILDQKNKDLDDLNQLRAKLYSIIAHDLKSPFTGLMGILNELDEHYDRYDEATKRTMINSLKRSSHNTYNLLVNLLDWTLLQKGKITVKPRPFQLRELTNEVSSLLASRLEAKQQSLIIDIPEIQANSDAEILKSILLNLTNNAIKFSPEGSTIHLKVEKQQQHYYFEVRDTGIGIPPDEIKHLFNLDMKFQRKGTAKEPGTGLGLLMCKEFVGLLNGEIGVESKPDAGSVFWFRIPHNI